MQFATTRDRARPHPKTVRQYLAHIVVVAEICPQAPLRVFGLVAQLSIVPLSIEFHRSSRVLHMRVEMERIAPASAEVLVSKIAAIPTVRSARYATRRKRRLTNEMRD